MKTYFLSFCPIGGKNLGICIVDAEGEEAAIKKVKKLKIIQLTALINIKIFQIDPDGEDVKTFPKDTLITPEQLLNKGYEKLKRSPSCPIHGDKR